VSLHDSRIKLFGDINMKKFIAFMALVVCCSALEVQAGSFRLVPSVLGWFDEAFNPIAAPVGNPGTPVVAQVEFDMFVDSLAAGEDGFGNVGFNINFGPGLSDFGDSNWQADNPTVDSNGPSPLGNVPLYGQNGDFGGSATDEQGILVSMATGAFTNAVDPRRTVGEAGGQRGLLGSVFVRWDGIGPAVLTIDGAQFSAKLTTGAFADVGQTSTITPLNFGGGPIVPEPSTLAMAGLSLIGLVLRRRNG
jgi:hypothetical protein